MSNRKLVAAIACRNDGARLYGKPLQNLDIQNGICVLDHIITHLQSHDIIEDIVLGISEGNSNLTYIDYAKKRGLRFIVGDERDVLSRLIQCGDEADGTDVFRVTSESPFMYFEPLQKAWSIHVAENVDATFLDNVPDGSGFEILSLGALKTSHREGEARHRSELCTLFIRENKHRFKLYYPEVPDALKRKDVRLTIDYPEDLIVCRAIYEHFKHRVPQIPVAEIIQFLDRNPSLLKLIAPFCADGYKTMYL